MNNPDNFPVDVEEQRDWLNARKSASGLSWTQLSAQSGVPAGTLSTFATGAYQGKNDTVARKVFKWRQLLASQEQRSVGLAIDPGYFETPSSERLKALMTIGQMGRITVGATGPGIGKSITAKEYQASVSNVWLATMMPTTKSVNAMIIAVLRAIGVAAKGGWGSQLSQLVMDSVRGRRGLLVIDEANHLSWEAFEEIRGWHDNAGVGVCFLGNEEMLATIRGGPRRDRFARLNSRIAQSHVQNLPVEADVAAFCDAWSIKDDGMRALLTRIALTPGAGALRECRQIVETASMFAADEERPISLGDLREAQSTRATRHIHTGN